MDYEKAYFEALNRAKAGKPIDEVFPELKESEDERIRKFLVDILSHGTWRKEWPFGPNEVVAYLEKQKEPLTPEEKMNHPLYLEGFDVGKRVGETLKEQQPAEWSEEDEKKIERLRSIVNECAFRNDALDVNGDYCEGDYAELDVWLKSLRPLPHWKPREEQMEAVLTAQSVGSYGHRKALAELYNDLKKVAHEDSSRHTDSPKKER